MGQFNLFDDLTVEEIHPRLLCNSGKWKQDLRKPGTLIVIAHTPITGGSIEAARFTNLSLAEFLFAWLFLKTGHRVNFSTASNWYSYHMGTMRNKIDVILRQYNFEYIVLDEARINQKQRLGFPMYRFLHSSHHRLVLTGTPINSLKDLGTVSHFLQPDSGKWKCIL